MKHYRLIKKEIGSSKQEEIISSSLENEIVDFVFYLDDLVFLTSTQMLKFEEKFLDFFAVDELGKRFFNPVKFEDAKAFCYSE